MEKDKVELVAIGGSAGSLEALLEILPALKPDFPVPLVLVLHRKSTTDTILTNLLQSRSSFRVREIEEKEPLRPGTLHIVPPDYHVLIEEDRTFSLDDSEKVNYSRPSIDVVFQSAAKVYQSGLVCVLLSGANADGTEGFRQVQELGGTTIAQSPESAEVGYMPGQAIAANTAGKIMNNKEIIAYLNAITR
ncbi:MAG: chemotaxis protein CheB [Flavipsychrobacter sp.]|nr:chemotaxis protein CheB [Flavipsychrobacter sp.]